MQEAILIRGWVHSMVHSASSCAGFEPHVPDPHHLPEAPQPSVHKGRALGSAYAGAASGWRVGAAGQLRKMFHSAHRLPLVKQIHTDRDSVLTGTPACHQTCARVFL